MNTSFENTKKLGVVLLNMGGPDSLEAVHPYLVNILRDPFILDMPFGVLVRPWLSRIIAKKRAPHSAARYEEIGGKTPLNAIAQEQAQVLEKALADLGVDACVLPGMRYWTPLTETAIQEFSKAGMDSIVAVSMYPQYCRATTGSSLHDFKRACKRWIPRAKVSTLESWPRLSAYVNFLSNSITQAVENISTTEGATAVLFSAHSIPVKLAQQGDPYQQQVLETYRAICEKLPSELYTALGWQSAAGPAKWLSPDSKTVLEQLKRDGYTNLIVAPLGFVAENLETCWDMDIDLKKHAQENGFQNFGRIPCPNADKVVMQELAQQVVEILRGA